MGSEMCIRDRSVACCAVGEHRQADFNIYAVDFRPIKRGARVPTSLALLGVCIIMCPLNVTPSVDYSVYASISKRS